MADQADASPEDDLEIIESADIPSDPNTNQPATDQPPTQQLEVQAADIDFASPDSSMLSPELDALDTIQAEQQNSGMDQFVVEDNEYTQPTDPNTHNKTSSIPVDMFSFFKVDGADAAADGDAAHDEAPEQPQSKRAESMTGLHKLDYDELNVENLKKFNANTMSRTSDDENDEEKEVQPTKTLHDASSLHSQDGSEHHREDINAEQHNADLANQPDERAASPLIDDAQNIPIEEKMEDSEIPMGIVTPSFVDQTHQSHHSVHKIPAVLHSSDAVHDEETPHDAEYGDDPGIPADIDDDEETAAQNRLRSGTSVVRPDIDPYGTPIDAQQDTMAIDEDAEFNYDVEANSDDDMVVTQPPIHGKHVSRKSISEMIDAQLAQEIDDPELLALHHGQTQMSDELQMAGHGGGGQAGGDYGSDEEAFNVGMRDEQNWMETAKAWMQKEKQLKEEIVDLEEELAKADQTVRDMEIETEKRVSKMEDERNELVSKYEEDMSNLRQDHQMATEKLNNDNSTMARDLKFLSTEVSTQKEHIHELESKVKELQEELGHKENEWTMHCDQCPLLNEEIAKQVADKHRSEVQRYRVGSQQMDQTISKMISENKSMEDEIQELKEKNATQTQQIEHRNVEIDKLREELERVKASANQQKGALEELRLTHEEEQRKRIELEQEYQRLGNEYDMLMAYSNEQAQVLEMAEFVPTGIDPQKFEAVKNKKIQFTGQNRGASRSFVQSMGGLSDVLGHMKTLSNMSDALRSGAMAWGKEDEHKSDESAAETESVAASTQHSDFDIASIASNFTRFSFAAYHTHDASREFFFLLSLCVKLSLAAKYAVSPDVAPNNENLWKQALANDVKFHEYYDFLYAELSNLYEYKLNTQQNKIRNVVITEQRQIRQMRQQHESIKQLEQNLHSQSYVYNQLEHLTKGPQSVQHRLNTMRDRTHFSPNDHLFGGNIKITTRANRQQHLQSHRSSQSSKRSSRSHRKRKPRSLLKQKDKDVEPGNDKHHPLNDDDKRRGSQKLSQPPPDPDDHKPKSAHLTQKSLELLDPDRNGQV